MKHCTMCGDKMSTNNFKIISPIGSETFILPNSNDRARGTVNTHKALVATITARPNNREAPA